jgi:hypothetical protein
MNCVSQREPECRSHNAAARSILLRGPAAAAVSAERGRAAVRRTGALSTGPSPAIARRSATPPSASFRGARGFRGATRNPSSPWPAPASRHTQSQPRAVPGPPAPQDGRNSGAHVPQPFRQSLRYGQSSRNATRNATISSRDAMIPNRHANRYSATVVFSMSFIMNNIEIPNRIKFGPTMSASHQQSRHHWRPAILVNQLSHSGNMPRRTR